MQSIKKTSSLLVFVFLLIGSVSYGQKTKANSSSNQNKKMNTYVIERNIPNVGDLSNAQLQEVAQKSCGVVSSLGSEIEWDHSYISGNKMFCIYRATSEELVREHGKKGGFPVDNVYQVSAIFSPESAKGVIQNLK